MKTFLLTILSLLAPLLQDSAAFLQQPSSTNPVAPWGVRSTTGPSGGEATRSSSAGRRSRVTVTWGVSRRPRTPLRAAEAQAPRAGSSAPRIIIAGAPASGKGTQCERIREEFGVVHLSTGDMLRAAVAAGTPVGREAREYMDSGRLVPDSTIIGVVSAVARG